MAFIMEYAGAIIFGFVVLCLIAVTIRTQYKKKGSCACGGGSCGGPCASSGIHKKNDRNGRAE